MSLPLRKDILYLSALLFLACALFGFKLGACGLLDPDEPFYALTAKEMLQHHSWLTPVLFGQPQFEKPILFYWVIVACFRLFGITEFAARLGPCVAGILTVLVTYLWARIITKKSGVAFVSAAVLATGIECILLSHLVLTDMVFSLFVTAAFCSFTWGYACPEKRKIAWLCLFLFCALGFLTKGPLGVLLPFCGIVLFLTVSGELGLLREMPWVGGLALFLLVGVSWYALETAKYGVDFLRQFFVHENLRRFFVAEHKSFDRVYFYPVALLFGTFPWGVFLPAAFVHGTREAARNRSGEQRHFLFLVLLILFIFCFFMTAKSKLLSYLFPVFPAVAILTGVFLCDAARSLQEGASPSRGLLFFTFFYWAVLPLAVVIGTAIYGASSGLHVTGPLLAIGASWVPCSVAGFVCLMKKKFRMSFGFVAASMFFFSFFVFGWLMPNVDGAFASRAEARLYDRLTAAEKPGLLLTSKLTVRGVAYYTGNERVAILAEDPRGLFYTPHPVPVYSNTGDLLGIDREAFPVYCFLRNKEWGLLKTITAGHFVLSVVDATAGRVLVRLDRVA